MPTTVVITGGSGSLGRALVPLLTRGGVHVRLFDLRPPDGELPRGVDFIAGDVRDRDEVERALDGADVLVHAAAWHGIHLATHSPDDFWSLNVDGTFAVYEAAAQRRVGRAIFSSTMGVYGASAARDEAEPAVRVDEDAPALPTDVYGLSKVAGEATAAFYHRARGVRGVALRFGMFVPEPFLRYGVRLLYGGVDERDVATAVLAAMETLEAEPERPFRAYNVHSPLPYDDVDAPLLARDPMAVVARHWPDAPALLERTGAELWGPVRAWYDTSRARHELGWRPEHDFTAFVDALRASVGDAATAMPGR